MATKGRRIKIVLISLALNFRKRGGLKTDFFNHYAH